MEETKSKYADIISCYTAEEVYSRVREWTTDKSKNEHIIRSTILDIHANIESRMKYILFNHMKDLISYPNKKLRKERMESLKTTINQLGFMMIYRILKPCLDSFPAPEFEDIPKINELRNKVTHSDISNVKYKDRKPFENHDCFAQLFVDSYAINKQLRGFNEKMIDDPRAMAKNFEEHYYKCKVPKK